MDFYPVSTDLAHIERSNLSAPVKSRQRRLWDKMIGGDKSGLERVTAHAVGAGHALRQGVESAAVGVALGYYEAKKGSLDAGKTPVDGIVAGVGLALGIAAAGHEVATDLRNVGAGSLAILAQRKSKDFFKTRAGNTPMPPVAGSPHGDFGEDPVVAAARAMG